MEPADDQIQKPNGPRLERPLVIFDGDCGFCRKQVSSWQKSISGSPIDFAPFQEVGEKFPEIPKENFSRSVQLVLVDGTIFSGAEAVFRILAANPKNGWMLFCYQNIPLAKPVCEFAYNLVAEHRTAASALTNTVCQTSYQPSYELVRFLFLRVLGLVYFFAFLSFAGQALGLIGTDGILPVSNFMAAAKVSLGPERYWLLPTLFWFNSTNLFVNCLAYGGVALSILLISGIMSRPVLALLWVFFLSLATVSGEFLSFQWDALLLEAGFIAILMAPNKFIEAPFNKYLPGVPDLAEKPCPKICIWLLRFLLFRLMFSSGAVKLLSGDPNWANLTALEYHYWTQPLPTPLAWYAAMLPHWFQKLSAVLMFTVELGAPWFIFSPRRLRIAAAFVLVSLQILIALTGNYAFFNLLSIGLCLSLLDDQFLRRFLPSWPAMETTSKSGKKFLVACASALILFSSSVTFATTIGGFRLIPRAAFEICAMLDPFRIVSSYGLFAIMTTRRQEIIVEGSADGKTWLPYEFKYKPGELDRPPPIIAPFQPRLDWQMWFAALGTYEDNHWFLNFVGRLLEGSHDVLALLAKNPFPQSPPKFIRAELYDYHFTNLSERQATGAYWSRQYAGIYFPATSLGAK